MKIPQRRKEAWEMTREEYEALPDSERYALRSPVWGGCNPSHTNYRMLATWEALARGERVSVELLEAEDKQTQHGYARVIAKAKNATPKMVEWALRTYPAAFD